MQARKDTKHIALGSLAIQCHNASPGQDGSGSLCMINVMKKSFGNTLSISAYAGMLPAKRRGDQALGCRWMQTHQQHAKIKKCMMDIAWLFEDGCNVNVFSKFTGGTVFLPCERPERAT